MNEEWLDRTKLLLGNESVDKLSKKSVLVVGLGGVGATAAEMICRAGVGKITIVDSDVVSITNINRQLLALHSNIGDSKTQVLSNRMKDINPNVEIIIIDKFIEEGKSDCLFSNHFDYVIDAIDTLSPKVDLICNALNNSVKIVSSMGAGGKIDPSLVKIADLKKSYNCHLARSLRKRLHKLGIKSGFSVVFSPEDVDSKAVLYTPKERNKKSNVGTISYMPSLFGIYCASKVIRDLLN